MGRHTDVSAHRLDFIISKLREIRWIWICLRLCRLTQYRALSSFSIRIEFLYRRDNYFGIIPRRRKRAPRAISTSQAITLPPGRTP